MSSTLGALSALTTVTSGTLFYAVDTGVDYKVTPDKIVSGGGGATAATITAVDLTTWVGRYRFDSIAGSDGDAIASITNIGGGTADAAVQATGAAKPTLKTASNGINGHNVARFDGGDQLKSTLGGASLTGDLYMWGVFKHTNAGLLSVVSAGDASGAGKWRLMLKYGNFTDKVNAAAFIGNSSDFDYSTPLASGTVYLMEVSVASGTASIWVNGAFMGSKPLTLNSFASTVLFIGTDPNGGQNFIGDIAECAFLGSSRTQALGTAVLDYCTNRYAIAPLGGWGATNLARFNTAGQELAGSQISDDGKTIGMYGAIQIRNYVNEMAIVNRFSNFNTLVLQNLHSAGLAAVSCLDYLATEGSEANLDYASATFGYGNPNAAGVFGGIGYAEVANFHSSTHLSFAIVQTASGTGNIRRFLMDGTTADMTFYTRGASYPSEVVALAIKGNADIVPGTAALATNATAGFWNLPTCAGTPTGTPTVYTGRVAMIYDTTAHKIWVYDGGAWRSTIALL